MYTVYDGVQHNLPCIANPLRYTTRVVTFIKSQMTARTITGGVLYTTPLNSSLIISMIPPSYHPRVTA